MEDTRFKEFEREEGSRRADPKLPLIARLDGRAFHTFTRDLQKPFDPGLVELMRETTKYLVVEFQAMVGYTQSDEITLCWPKGPFVFDGRYQKIASILSAAATGFFVAGLPLYMPFKDHARPMFDARLFQVPDLATAQEVFAWRERDAIKNSITMVAGAHFSHKQLHGVNGKTKRAWLKDAGDPWEDYPSKVQRGSSFSRVQELRMLSEDELERILPPWRPDGPIMRSSVKEIDSFTEVFQKLP